MTSRTITIPAREVRPGDVLFGMTVKTSQDINPHDHRVVTEERATLLLPQFMQVTVERPVPSDPIGTVRARFTPGGETHTVFQKARDGWESTSGEHIYGDAEVADFPILWKPGMPIPTEGVQA